MKNYLTAIIININARQIFLPSAYFPHDDAAEPPSLIVKALVDYYHARNRGFLVRWDANSHNTLWASTDSNERGESLMEYILENQLVIICNTKSERGT